MTKPARERVLCALFIFLARVFDDAGSCLPAGRSRTYLAYSITRVSLITDTLISPGYCISFSI